MSVLLSFIFLASSATVLKTANELLTYEKLNRSDEVQFEIEGMVLFPPNLNSIIFFIADKSGAARLLLDNEEILKSLSAGDIVRAVGTTRPADSDQFYCPSVDNITILGHTTPPPAPKIEASEFRSGRYDNRVVFVEGVVREAFFDEINREILLLVLQTGHGFVHVAIGSTLNPCRLNPDTLLTRTVRVHGIVNRHPVSLRSYLGRTLSVLESKDIELLPTMSENRFDLPDVSILRVENIADIPSFDRHRAEGRVLAIWKQRRRLVIRTARGDIVSANIRTNSNNLPSPGDVIETAGYPISDGFTITLSQAEWRQSPASLPSEEAPKSLPEELAGESLNHIVILNGHVVQTSGTVLRIVDDETEGRILLLETGQRIVKVSEGALTDPFREFAPGCRISVTGVCSLETDSPTGIFPHAIGFSIVPRTSDELRLIANPPWWTPARLLLLIGGLIATIVAILIWNRSLHRLAERRGREMSRRQLQAQRTELKRLERTKLAVELHDAISQSLTGISMQLKAVGAFTRQIPTEAAEHIGFAVKALGSCRTELRNVLWDLRHNAIDAPSMDDAVRQTLEPHLGDVSLDIDFAIPRSRFDENTAYSILRILRELVTNAIRHGHATALTIRADADQDARIVFTDNGIGFDPDNHPGLEEGHFGLVGIGERIETMNGTLSIDSSSSGTTVTIRFPL